MIREALEVMREKGWIKGRVGNAYGRCMVGAYKEAAGFNVHASDWCTYDEHKAKWDLFKEPVLKVIGEQYPERLIHNSGRHLGEIPLFNDHPETTWEEVERVLEKAAILEDEAI